MKKFLLACLLALILPVLTIPLPAGAYTPEQQAEFQANLERWWADYGSGFSAWNGQLGAIVLSGQGEMYGLTGGGASPDPNVHFRGASTTKTITAASILWLYQRGFLNLDDMITANIPGTSTPYVPDTPAYDVPNKGSITIRQLLRHRAGVFDVTNDVIPASASAPYAGQNYLEYVRGIDDAHTFTFDELVGVAADNQLSYFLPGAAYHYSNTGYSILGKIVERVSGQTYRAFVQEKLFDPNGLTNCSLPDQGLETTLPEAYLTGYSYENGAVTETTQDNMSGNVAEGNVITTPRDLATWANRLYTGQAGLNMATVTEMEQVIPTNDGHGGAYGLGCTFTPGLGYGHNGGHEGYVTVMRYNPNNGVTVVVFATIINFTDLGSELFMMYDVAAKSVSWVLSRGDQVWIDMLLGAGK